jgi:hypothetical protein
MVNKGFHGRWIKWVMQALEGGKVSVNVNDEQ